MKTIEEVREELDNEVWGIADPLSPTWGEEVVIRFTPFCNTKELYEHWDGGSNFNFEQWEKIWAKVETEMKEHNIFLEVHPNDPETVYAYEKKEAKYFANDIEGYCDKENPKFMKYIKSSAFCAAYNYGWQIKEPKQLKIPKDAIKLPDDVAKYTWLDAACNLGISIYEE